MSITSPAQLSDRGLLDAVVHAANAERQTTVDLLRLLAELDARRLYLGQGCSSLFTFCTQVLQLSEHAAYHRIEAARAARRFPILLDLLTEGAVNLTTVTLLRPHLTDDNHRHLLEAARHKSKRDVEHQIACLSPRPDAAPVVRKLPTPVPTPATATGLLDVTEAPQSAPALRIPRPTVTPTAPGRYLVKVTVGAETHAKLRRAQDLLRHTIPNGDHAAILDRALTLLVDHLERARTGRTIRPRPAPTPTRSASRHVPAEVKRAVWARDGGRCAFEGPHGRCRETGHLEFHHLVPFARGGRTDVSNLALRCRAHNQFEGELAFGPRMPADGAILSP